MLSQGTYKEAGFQDPLFGLAGFPMFSYIAKRFIQSLDFFNHSALWPLYTANRYPSLQVKMPRKFLPVVGIWFIICLKTGINQSWWWAENQLPLLSQKHSYLWGNKTLLHLTQENHPSLQPVWSPQWWKIYLPSYWQDIKVLYSVIKPPS